MKKFIVSLLVVLFCGVLSAADTDMYLFWMIADKVNLDGRETGSLSGYSAHMVINTATGPRLIYAYGAPEDTTPIGTDTRFDAEAQRGWDLVSRVGDLAPESTTFFVELLNSDYAAVFQSEMMSYSELLTFGAISAMVGMVQPAGTYGFSEFHTVPEPTSGVLLLIGLAGLALRRRKMKKV